MLSRIDNYRHVLIKVCRELSDRHEDLVFWKHLDRGLNGLGDIDTFSAPERLDFVVSSVHECAFHYIPGVKAVVCCSHVRHARLLLIVVDELYPNLLEIDIGSKSTRLGIELFDAPLLRKHSCYTREGIRKLRGGAQAVVLMFVYGLSSSGICSIKEHDYNALVNGLRSEREVARRFWSELRVSMDMALFENLCDSLLAGIWPSTTIAELWWLLLYTSLRVQGRLSKFDLFLKVVDRLRPLCSVRNIVLNSRRVATVDTWQEFLKTMDGQGHRVYRSLDY